MADEGRILSGSFSAERSSFLKLVSVLELRAGLAQWSLLSSNLTARFRGLYPPRDQTTGAVQRFLADVTAERV